MKNKCKAQEKRSKGNTKEQRKRRKERLQNLPLRKKVEYELIDGNWSHYPVAECKIHCAYLTQGLVDTHRCVLRGCPGFRQVIDNEE